MIAYGSSPEYLSPARGLPSEAKRTGPRSPSAFRMELLPKHDQAVTHLLERLNQGDRTASEELLAQVFEELRSIAWQQMKRQAGSHTLQPTALVNEAYLRLFRGVQHDFNDRCHFLALASRAMRSVLVDHARAKGRKKRQADGERVPLDSLVEQYEERSANLVELDAALEKLGRVDPRMVQVVELRFFAGRSVVQTAEVLGVSERTVEREWTAAKAWIGRELS